MSRRPKSARGAVDRPLPFTYWHPFIGDDDKLHFRILGRRSPQTWGTFLAKFAHSPEVALKKTDVGAFTFSTYRGDRRLLENLESGVACLALDIDKPNADGKWCTLDDIARLFAGTTRVIFSSHGYAPHKPKFRLVVLLSRCVNVDEYRKLWRWANSLPIAPHVDQGAKSPVQCLFVPSRPPGAEHIVREFVDAPLDVDKVLREFEDISHTTPGADTCCPRARPMYRHQVGERGGPLKPARDCSRSAQDFALCCRLMRAGRTDKQVAAELRRKSPKVAEKSRKLATEYIDLTIRNARIVFESSAPIMQIARARIVRMHAHHQHTERTHLEFELVGDEGRTIKWLMVVPDQYRRGPARMWRACFADVDPDLLTAPFDDAVAAFKSFRWRGRKLAVGTTRGGNEVEWAEENVGSLSSPLPGNTGRREIGSR